MSIEAEDTGSRDDAQLTALIALYDEHNTDARWQEECRERSASAIIAANSIIIGIIAAFKLQFPFLIFCAVQYVLAGTGQKFILKYHALSERRHANASALQRLIIATRGLAPLGVDKIFKQAREQQLARLKKDSVHAEAIVRLDEKSSIHELWYALHSGFKVMSLLLALLIVLLDLQSGRPDSFLLQIWDAGAALFASFKSPQS
jgi:hypothetical protein